MAYTPYLPIFLDKIARKGEVRARSGIRSKQLRRGLYIADMKRKGKRYSRALTIPHFWAVYINDGRRAVNRSNGYLVWFRNPKDDPRLFNGNTPQRLAQTRKLSKAEWEKWTGINRVKINEYRRRTGKRNLTSTDYQDMKLPMIVARRSPGDGRRVEGEKFFDNEAGGGMQGFAREAGQEAVRGTSIHVRRELARAKLLNVKKTVTIKF